MLRELQQLPRRMGGPAGVPVYALAVLALGILMPWRLGLDFIDASVLLAYAGLPLLLVAPVVAESLAGDRGPAPTSATERRQMLYGKVAAGVMYGWISAVLILVMGIITAGVAFGHPILPPTVVSIDLLLLSLTISIFGASVSAAVSMGARSVKHAKRTLRQGFLLLLVTAVYYARLSGEWKQRLAIPPGVSGFTEFAAVASVVLLSLSGGLLRIAWNRSEDTEIRLNISG
jgi:hypothetical protein